MAPVTSRIRTSFGTGLATDPPTRSPSLKFFGEQRIEMIRRALVYYKGGMLRDGHRGRDIVRVEQAIEEVVKALAGPGGGV